MRGQEFPVNRCSKVLVQERPQYEMPIHPSAIVHPGAEIDPTAEIGPFCTVGPRVVIGPHTRLLSHVVVDNATTLGSHNTVYPFATVGSAPQDLKFRGEPARLVIGDHNVIREGATLNIGTEGGHMETRIGSHCLIMAYSHVAHDCRLGDRVILSNAVALAGHVDIGDGVIMGGLVGVHQFCRIGERAFLAGGAMVAQDVPPFCIAQGDRAQLVGLNIVGLKRSGWTRAQLRVVREAYAMLFLRRQGTYADAIAHCEQVLAQSCDKVAQLCAFVRASERGVCHALRHDDSSPSELTEPPPAAPGHHGSPHQANGHANAHGVASVHDRPVVTATDPLSEEDAHDNLGHALS